MESGETASCEQDEDKTPWVSNPVFANLCHEIRTPLGAIVGISRILKNADCSPHKQSECIAALQDSATMLMDLVNNILDLSRLQAGAMPVEQVPFSLKDVAAKAVHIVAGQAEEKGLKLVQYIGDVPPLLAGDPLRLQQVMLNLLSNAVKFTQAGEVTLEMQARPAGEGRYNVCIRVRDTGIGICKQRQKTIFKAFEQADPATARRYGGTGLGLAICRQLVELMGGNITLQSEPGAGSVFTVELVLCTPTDGQAAASG